MIRYVLAMLVIASPALAQDAGLATWSKIHEVFSHPRCANCHVGPDNVPIWSGSSYGPRARPHGMNINGGASRDGTEYIPCGSCHQTHDQAQLPHGPPHARDAAAWVLAPVEMQWFGKSSAEICAQIKDPARTRGRSIAAIAEHVEHDKLVAWGWDAGPGREKPPYSAADVAKFLRQWDEKEGAPCPTN
jgi:hypothetical protein